MLTLKDLEDEELIFFLELHNEEAFSILLERYRIKARGLVGMVLSEFSNSGVSFEDLVGVAAQSVSKALKSFDLSKSKFVTYWSLVAKREIIDYLYENSYKGKGAIFAGISPNFRNHDDDEGIFTLSDSIADRDETNSVDMLYKEFIKIIEKDRCVMTDLDKQIFLLYLKGNDKNDVMNLLGCTRTTYYRAIEKGKYLLSKNYKK